MDEKKPAEGDLRVFGGFRLDRVEEEGSLATQREGCLTTWGLMYYTVC
ncbi:hypothetical protein EJMOOK_02835 [Rhodanobacter sp. Root179]|jgi:hypothetical protein